MNLYNVDFRDCWRITEEKEMDKNVLSGEILKIWYSKKKDVIESTKKEKIGEIIDSDPMVQRIRVHVDEANETIKEADYSGDPRFYISPNYQLCLTKESKDKVAQVKGEATFAIKELDETLREIKAMLLLCNGRSDKEAEVLFNYGITDGIYGKLVI